MPSPSSRALAAITSAAVLAGCGAASDASAPRWVAEADTIGDTVVVRTIAGSVWPAGVTVTPEVTIGQFEGPDEYVFGEIVSLTVAADGSIFLYDRQAKALRQYAPDGTYVRTIGREGGGPGEYRRPDAGLAITPDGRLLLRDPGNARINIYSLTGESLGSWRIEGGFSTSNPLFVDAAGRVYTPGLMDRTADVTRWRNALIRVGPDSITPDTLPVPELEHEPKVLVARHTTERGTSTSVNSVPFTASAHWAYSPLGYFVVGVSDRYAISLLRTGEPVLRIEKAWTPVPVNPEEKAEAERRSIESMRFTDPNWRWDGPGIPDTKPAFRSIFVAADGRIWVQLHQPAFEIELEEETREPRPGRLTPQRWVEPLVYDIFEPDGRYLGAIELPRNTSVRYARGDHLWAITRDEFDVQYVTRFRIQTAEPIADR